MIKNPIDFDEMRRSVLKANGKWFDNGDKKLAKFSEAGRFTDKKGSWSVIKPLYLKHQFNKCIYCERRLNYDKTALVEYDVEHFRPKNEVPIWPQPDKHGVLNYPFPTGDEFENGYYWLSYTLENYCVSCKECNTSFKLNWFPIMGNRGQPGQTVDQLAAERPFLCYPLSSSETDPETLIGFEATTAFPKGNSADDVRRGQVIIDFFGLNTRDLLHEERAINISTLATSLIAIDEGRSDDGHKMIVAKYTSIENPHANCLRCFHRVWQADRGKAMKIYAECRRLVGRRTQ